MSCLSWRQVDEKRCLPSVGFWSAGGACWPQTPSGTPPAGTWKGCRPPTLFLGLPFPRENHRKIIRTNIGKRSAIMVNLWKRYGQKLRGITGPCGSYNFSICLWENPRSPICMISGCSGVSLSPTSNIIYLWKPRHTSKNLRKFHIFQTITLYKNKI